MNLKNLKRIILLSSLLLISVVVFPQKYNFDNTIINIGCSDKNDLSMTFAGRVEGHIYAGLDYTRNYKTKMESTLIGLGYGCTKCVFLMKVGQSHNNLNNVNKTPFESNVDCGVEYLWLLDSSKKVTLCYGMGWTKSTGVQLRLGTSF
jgi:hypothetical protein